MPEMSLLWATFVEIVPANWVLLKKRAELEAEAGIFPKGNLVSTLERYNADAAAGRDALFRKEVRWLQPLATPPYVVLDLSLEKYPFWSAFTLGGLHTRPTDSRFTHRTHALRATSISTSAGFRTRLVRKSSASGTVIDENPYPSAPFTMEAPRVMTNRLRNCCRRCGPW